MHHEAVTGGQKNSACERRTPLLVSRRLMSIAKKRGLISLESFVVGCKPVDSEHQAAVCAHRVASPFFDDV
jgi:hypothetical protein